MNDPRKLADTVREARDVADALSDAADKGGVMWAQLTSEQMARKVYALVVALAEQLRTELDEAQRRHYESNGKWESMWLAEQEAKEQAEDELERERAARESAERERDKALRDVRDMSTGAWGSSATMIVALKHRSESAEAALRTAQQESAELRAALTDELDNWNPERRPTIAAELRAAQARAEELRSLLNRFVQALARERGGGTPLTTNQYVDLHREARAVLAASPQAGEFPEGFVWSEEEGRPVYRPTEQAGETKRPRHSCGRLVCSPTSDYMECA